ncbi:MAG: phenylacetate--CoA ligase family protein [Candidatus Magasanikbacteria bacterium]
MPKPIIDWQKISAKKFIKLLGIKPESFWVKRGEAMTLQLFNQMATRVPAYRNFLRKSGIKPQRIKSISNFKKIPTISKDSYLKKYDLGNLCWDGEFSSRHWDVSSTSGSTGVPYYFPRSDRQNAQYAFTAELYLRNNFFIHKKTTLYVNCFALGVWIGGLFTYEALKLLTRHGVYGLTVINPGLNKIEILKAISRLGGDFDQVIIGGYPPFVKDVIDDGSTHGVDWKKYNIKFIFSAEGFSEKFRDYIFACSEAKNIYLDSLNHYGTVDQGTLAHETPLSVMIRRLALKDAKLYSAIFGANDSQLPTLAQYHPELFYFEEINGSLLCSAYSGLPLVRYDLKDYGGVVGFEEMKNIFFEHGYDLWREAKKAKINKTVWQIPFVYVRARKDLSVSLSGANIYPETIKNVLIYPEFSKTLTGKFTLLVKHDKNQNPFLELNIELKKNVSMPSLNFKKRLVATVVAQLLKENSEYKIIHDTHKRKRGAYPVVVFHYYESDPYFRSGGKQKWVIK